MAVSSPRRARSADFDTIPAARLPFGHSAHARARPIEPPSSAFATIRGPALPAVDGLLEEIAMAELERDKVLHVLNRILETELAGVVRYTHYSLLVFGYGRIPVVAWMRAQANESLLHAQQAGEWITQLGAYPSLGIGPLLDSHRFDIGDMLRESLAAEAEALALYRELLDLVRDRSVALEEFARQMIAAEECHAGEVDKMLRKPGRTGTA
jgi:bacterioferritin